VPDLWVLDTSVAVGWFFADEPLRSDALAVRARLSDEPQRFVVPTLFYSELVHVLARKSGRDAEFVQRAVTISLRLGIRTVALSEQGWQDAARWSCRGISGYDATSVALAQDLNARWLTADERAVKISGTDFSEMLRGFGRRH
jgi:predicted nucleic acid-binding protein